MSPQFRSCPKGFYQLAQCGAMLLLAASPTGASNWLLGALADPHTGWGFPIAGSDFRCAKLP